MSSEGAKSVEEKVQRRRRSNQDSEESKERKERPAQTDCKPSPAPNERRLVLLGRTGAGKSATGNSILGNQCFDDGLSMSSVTKECKRECATVEGRQLVLVDTPGIFDTNLTEEELQEEVIRCLALSSPGPHAFLLVVPIERYTEEQQRTVQMILEMFHEDIIPHTILIFSHADRLGGESIEDFLSRQDQKVQELVERFGRRFLAFDNKNQTNPDQVNQLMQRVDELLHQNQNQHFTSEIMQKAQKRERREAERMKTIRKEVKKLADDRWRKFIASMNEERHETERNMKRIESRIDQMKTNIEEENQNVRPIPARLKRFRASLRREQENMKRVIEREMEEEKERAEREEREMRDLDIWMEEEEERRQREEEEGRQREEEERRQREEEEGRQREEEEGRQREEEERRQRQEEERRQREEEEGRQREEEQNNKFFSDYIMIICVFSLGFVAGVLLTVFLEFFKPEDHQHWFW